VVGVRRSLNTLLLLVPVALLPPREQACENPSSITLISFVIAHREASENANEHIGNL